MSDKKDIREIFESFRIDGNFEKVDKLLGRGSFGEVRDIIYKSKPMAGKIVKMKENEQFGEQFAADLKGQNIIKISKIISKQINGENYNLIIMEKALLRDLGKLNDYYHNHNLLKLIYQPFDEEAGDFLVRFYAKQIINALEILNRGDFVHFDIKPENLLISVNLVIKLSDFSLLKKIKDTDNIMIPGGTNGYLTLEFYKKNKLSGDDIRKQDYFALGATLYFLKYGKQMIKYKKGEDNDSCITTILTQLQKEISKIRSGKFTDPDFIDFLTGLLGFTPKDRPNFEQIYRNKWLNKDLDKLHEVFWGFEYDEEKLIMELQKNDYLVKKEKIFNKNPSRFKFKKRQNRH
jgi:serine/threonine protein kinase